MVKEEKALIIEKWLVCNYLLKKSLPLLPLAASDDELVLMENLFLMRTGCCLFFPVTMPYNDAAQLSRKGK